jgi:hypothetical protein
MAGPWDFTLRPMTPLSNSLEAGQRIGGGILDAAEQGARMRQQGIEFDQKQQDRAAEIAAQQAATQAAVAKAAELKAARDALLADPTNILLWRKIGIIDPKGYGSPDFKAQYDRAEKSEQQETWRDLAEVKAALQADKPEVAIELLSQKQVAYENGNRLDKAKDRAALAEKIQEDPFLALQFVTAQLAPISTPDQITALTALNSEEADKRAAVAKADKDEAEAQKAETEALFAAEEKVSKLALEGAQKTEFEARAKNYAAELGFKYQQLRETMAMEREKLAAQNKANEIEGEKLSTQELKQQNEMSDDAAKTLVSAKMAENIAKTFRGDDVKGAVPGYLGKKIEQVKAATGFKNDITKARQMYDKFKADKVIENLPPGAASDKDIALMSQPFPESTDDTEFIAEYMDTVAKLQRKSYAIKTAKAQWQAANHSLGQMKREGVSIDMGNGPPIMIPNGMPYDVFIRDQLAEEEQ